MLCGRNNSREARVARPIVLSALSLRIGALARCLFRIGEQAFGDVFHAAAALSAPRATIFNVSSGSGRCSAFASSRGARIQTSRSSSVVRITGIAFGWIGSTIALDDAVKKPSTRCGRTSGLRLRTPRSSLRASARRAEPLYQSRFMRSVLEGALRSFVTEAAAGGHSTPRPVRQFLSSCRRGQQVALGASRRLMRSPPGLLT